MGVTINKGKLNQGFNLLGSNLFNFVYISEIKDPKRYKREKMMGSWLRLGQCAIGGQWKKRNNAD